MTILIGVDESPHAAAAVERAKSMAWPAGTSFVVVTAVPSPAMAYGLIDIAGMTWAQPLEEELTRQATERTACFQRELREAGWPAEARVERGDPRHVLVDVARATGADLVIVGSHGRTGFDRLLLGSVASHVVGHAPCSVLVVKAKLSGAVEETLSERRAKA